MKKFTLTILLLIIIPCIVRSQIKIGLALPLMTGSSDETEKMTGTQMLNGIKDAIEDYNKSGSAVKISTVIEDTKKNQSATLDILNKFGSDSSVIAVLGPVYSSELVNNTGAALFHKIPVITPTATLNNLAKNNPYVFQLNPTYDVRGRLIARYAMNELGMKNFVILSENAYGKNFADSFSDEVQKSKGTVELTEYYSKDSVSVSGQIENIKKFIFEKDKFIDFGKLTANQNEKLKSLKFEYSDFNSLKAEGAVISIYRLFGKNAVRIMDSLKIFPSVITEMRNVIPGCVNAVYIPVSGNEDIKTILPIYIASGINLPILGNSDWNNSEALSESGTGNAELYFDSDFYLKDDEEINNKGLSEQEIKNYYFGYDGMKLILDKISEGNKTRQSINNALEALKDYISLHNRITLYERTNHSMSVMNFKNGILKKVSDYEY